MSWKVRLGIGVLALLGALMVLGFVKSVVMSLVPLAILLLVGYGAYRLYVGSRDKAAESPKQLPTNTPPAVQARPTKDAATRLREIREEAARQQGQQQ